MGNEKSKNSPRILMVDDEADLIHGLRRILRSSQPWLEVEYFTAARDALNRLMETEFDVIITDMRMPEIDGAEFLKRSIAYSPASVRFVLSGQADERTILRCLPYTHQHIAKPCDVADLIQRILAVVGGDKANLSRHLRSQLSSMLRIPVQQSVLKRLNEELSSASPSPMVLSELLASDAGLSVKLLQLTNSSFFGHPEEIVSPARAVARLGVEVLRKIVRDAQVFEELVLPSGHEDLNTMIEQTAVDALFDSALEESLSQSELIAKIAQRCSAIGIISLAHWHGSRGSQVSLDDLQRVSKSSAEYFMTILGLPAAVVAAVSPVNCSTEAVEDVA
ncbi:MAG: response regulator [Oligoflexia bacterium]|nr:response regulator [Oligoflexia bacterium]